jgi:dihydropteroate synthase
MFPMSSPVPVPFELGHSTLSFERPRVMGIINATPDSFHTESRALKVEQALSMAERMMAQGADILDVGGQSSRPGAAAIDSEEECARVLPIIKALRNRWPSLALSVDTCRAHVAIRALDEGADIVNDIGGARLDAAMEDVLASRKAPCILMHMKGTPESMQDHPLYGDVLQEVRDFLEERLQTLRNKGVEHVALDPGFGFGKTAQHNFRLLDGLPQLVSSGVPILVGVSRKSMIHRTLDCSPQEALNGTTALHAWALDRGAHILRVHDVAEAVECLKLHRAMASTRMNNP